MSRLKSSARFEFERSHHILLKDYVMALSWSRDGSILAASSAAGEVMVWTWGKNTGNSTNGAIPVLTEAADRAMSCLGVSANTLLAAAGQDGGISVWDCRAPKLPLIGTFGDGDNWIDQLAWHPSRDWLVFGLGRHVQVWDIPANERLAMLDFENSSALSVAWHPAGTMLAVSGHGGVKFWKVDTWKEETYQLKVPGASIHVAWSWDGNYIASGNLDRTLSVLHWDNPPPWLMQGFPGKVRCVTWSPAIAAASLQLASACADAITVWEREPGGKNWQSSILQGHSGTVQAIAYHPTQSFLASGAVDGQVCLWHRAKKLGQRLKTRSSGVSRLAWRPTGQCLAVGCIDGTIEIWVPSRRGRGFQ